MIDTEVEQAARLLAMELGQRIHLQRRRGASERELKAEFFNRLAEQLWISALDTADELEVQCPVRRRVAEHLPGQHDQSEHGNRDGGGGPSAPDSVKIGGASPAIKGMFTPQEINLQKQPRQRAKTKESLFADAQRAKPHFDKALNHGEGVDKRIKARVVRPSTGEEFMAALTGEGPVVIIAPLKGEKRATEKVESKYKGDWSRLHDVVRATVAVDRISELSQAMEAIRVEMEENGWTMAEKPDDRISNPLPSGYRDVAMKFERDGHVAELQLNLKSMIIAKNGAGHKLYERQREIVAELQKNDRQATPEEQAEMERLDKEMYAIHSKAWANAA